MTVLEKKICMMGAPGVGKTSLVRRFVDSVFSEKYLSTIGVKIDKKSVAVEDTTLNLMLWDLQGEERYQWVRMQYLRGASGYILVADGTRPDTLEIALGLQENAAGRAEQLPFILCLNKADLWGQWGITATQQDWLKEKGWTVIQTSAKSGDSVEDAFLALARQIIAQGT
ncbi:MAG: Rab family GTPase [Gemmatimonadota bacterium]|nr:Rab family GTPase [Gemmatimonadota bacterium]